MTNTYHLMTDEEMDALALRCSEAIVAMVKEYYPIPPSMQDNIADYCSLLAGSVREQCSTVALDQRLVDTRATSAAMLEAGFKLAEAHTLGYERGKAEHGI